jgi:microcystin-dependent protein
MFKKSVKHATMLATAAALTAGLSMPQYANAMEPFIGQIQMVGFGFAPRSWTTCDGQLLTIAQNTALYSLLGTTFGGDGRNTFGLPDLRGRTALHVGHGPGVSPVNWGERGGAEQVNITTANMPSHNHTATSTLKGTNNAGNSATPEDNILASKGRTNIYLSATAPDVNMHGQSVETTVGNSGGGVPINVRNPYLGIYHVIALQGIYPSRN